LFAIQSLQSEEFSAQGILTEISQKAESIKAEFETQKIATAQLQVDVDALRQQQRSKQEEHFQINKGVEIREIQIASLKQEIDRATNDTHQRSASLVEFENKLVVLQSEIQEKNQDLERISRRRTMCLPESARSRRPLI